MHEEEIKENIKRLFRSLLSLERELTSLYGIWSLILSESSRNNHRIPTLTFAPTSIQVDASRLRRRPQTTGAMLWDRPGLNLAHTVHLPRHHVPRPPHHVRPPSPTNIAEIIQNKENILFRNRHGRVRRLSLNFRSTLLRIHHIQNLIRDLSRVLCNRKMSSDPDRYYNDMWQTQKRADNGPENDG